MEIPLFAGLYFLMGVLSLAVAVVMFRSYKKVQDGVLLILVLLFSFLFVRGMAISIPAFINVQNTTGLAIGGILAILAVYFLILGGVRLRMFMEQPFFSKNARTISIILAIVGAVSIFLLAYDFRTPTITDSGIIYWNTNPIATWITGLLSLLYGYLWFYFFRKEVALAVTRYQKFKTYVLAFDGITIGTAFFLTFTANNEFQVIAGLVILLAAIAVTLVTFLVPEKATS